MRHLTSARKQTKDWRSFSNQLLLLIKIHHYKNKKQVRVLQIISCCDKELLELVSIVFTRLDIVVFHVILIIDFFKQ